ncbi:bifunctional 2-polyprenyl-6-hydroxyphenol methylase/3-demethylubiquinol 3-O-methyltransferase UbiG [Lewinella sp. 4G2]|uniref:class I SAM-dependent methyltransferase n=1 Tax=Lewinella sp. 4G2 TaxID=1803372 RepID=UPI0007B47CA3|nr:class I SAM-dependent methyltransferase [Lewinella sp. 4G2]OAV45526.1 SAM-dependent methyltransferase [Lewinella sp. 4G2]
MHERHRNRKQYFQEQALTTRQFVIPYVERTMPVNETTRVFEIGCGEGGNLVPFIERGCECVGVDILQTKIDLGNEYLAEFTPGGNYELLIQDIYDASAERLGKFDLIVLRDVIEHIHDQERFLSMVHRYLKPGGRIFFGFPPWRMPFGGHQQVCQNKLLSKLPWFHLLPTGAYRQVLKLGGETQKQIDDLVEIKETGISISRFSQLVQKTGFKFDQKDLWFINPNYQVKFGLAPRKLPGLLGAFPWVKDFYTTCCYALISAK